MRLRHREQLAGTWGPPTGFHQGAVQGHAGVFGATDPGGNSTAGVATVTPVGRLNVGPVATAGIAGIAAASATAHGSFMTPSPRGISRGEQAVMARLSRLQAAAGAAGVIGVAPGGVTSGVSAGAPGAPGVAGVMAPVGVLAGGAGYMAAAQHHQHQMARQQMEFRRYQQALMAGGVAVGPSGGGMGGVAGEHGVGSEGAGNGGGAGAGRRACVQVAQ